MKLNDIQKVAIRGYAGGAHAWLAEQDEVTDQELLDNGDGLIRFLLRELGPEEDCENKDQALSRLYNVIDDLYGALNALENADPAPTA